MSVPNQIPESNYVGNGTTKTFAANFEYASDSDVFVTVNGIAPEIGQATFANGVFTFITAPANGTAVRVYRSTPIERDTEYDNHDNVFRPRVVNIDFDRIWFVLQEYLLSLGIINARITQEIADRIQADAKMMNYILNEDNELKADYILRDENLKKYVDQTIGAIIGNPDFQGIEAQFVKDASGKNQHQINEGQKVLNNGYESITEMLLIENPKNGMRVYVKGFRSPSNLALANPYRGGGDFAFIESLSAQNDGISVFNGWVRLNITEVTPEMAGAYADYKTDDEDAFVKAQELARKLRVPLRLSGLYAKSKPFVCIPWDVVLGTGHRTTRIRKISNATSGLAPRQAPEKPAGTFDDYDVDACLIFYPWDNTYADHITVRDVYFEQGEWGVDASRGYGFYAPRHAICNTENLQFENVLTAFYAKVFWNNTHKRIGSVSGVNPDGSKSGNTAMVVYDGEGQYTGTSNICEHFLLNNFKRGYEIQNLQTSTFTACYGEAISDANGANDTQIFFFVNPHDITLNGCGQESSYGTPLYISAQDGVPNCSITLNGFQAVWGTNGTTTEKYINMLTIDGPVTVTSNGSNFRKGNEGFIFDGFYLGAGSTLINNGSSFGAASVQHSGSRYIDVSTAITEKDGFSQSTKTVGNDLNNGCEDKAGLTVKSVKGATLNIPTGFTDVYGISEYFGLNATQGVQFFMQVPQGTVYKRTRTAVNTFTPWVEA